jgi:hypothetical protein
MKKRTYVRSRPYFVLIHWYKGQKKNIIQYKIITSSIYYSRPSIYKSNLSMNNVLHIFYCVFVYAMLTTKWLTKFVFYIFSSVFCVFTDEVTYCIWFNGFLTTQLYHISLRAFSLLLNLTWLCLLLLYDVFSIDMIIRTVVWFYNHLLEPTYFTQRQF